MRVRLLRVRGRDAPEVKDCHAANTSCGHGAVIRDDQREYAGTLLDTCIGCPAPPHPRHEHVCIILYAYSGRPRLPHVCTTRTPPPSRRTARRLSPTHSIGDESACDSTRLAQSTYCSREMAEVRGEKWQPFAGCHVHSRDRLPRESRERISVSLNKAAAGARATSACARVQSKGLGRAVLEAQIM